MPLPAAWRRTLELFVLACEVLGLGVACTTATETPQQVHVVATDGPAAPGTANPLAALTPSSDGTFVAIVQEELTAGAYTYMAVRTPDDHTRWIVTMGPGEAPGRSVRVKSMGERAEFHSPRLGRTFSSLIFATVEPIE